MDDMSADVHCQGSRLRARFGDRAGHGASLLLLLNAGRQTRAGVFSSQARPLLRSGCTAYSCFRVRNKYRLILRQRVNYQVLIVLAEQVRYCFWSCQWPN